VNEFRRRQANTELTLANETLTSFADTTDLCAKLLIEGRMRGKPTTGRRIQVMTANDDGHDALKRAAENSEGWRHKERMKKPALQQKTIDDPAMGEEFFYRSTTT